MYREEFLSRGEFLAAGLYEEPERGLFYRKALGIRRFYENCELAVYNGEALYPSGTIAQKMSITPYYLSGIHIGAEEEIDRSAVKKIKEEFLSFRSSVPSPHTVAGDMYTHSMPNYERILAEGLLSYVPRIKKIADADIKEGLLHLVAGIECYVKRCVKYLCSVGADASLITALKQVPLYPCRNIHEAIVGWNFILYLDNCDNIGALTKGLLPYFKGENIVPLLENLYSNLDVNNGYSMAMNADCPELAEQCLLAARGKRRPMIELFVDKDTPDAVWQAAFSSLKSGGQPAFYNGNILLRGLQARFPNIREQDIERFCGGGCTEAMITGFSAVGSLDAGINLLLILEEHIYNYLLKAASFDDFYSEYLSAVSAVVEEVKRCISSSRRERAVRCPLPIRTLLVDDCIDNGMDFNSGGARYNWSIISFAGMINVIDAMLNIKEYVFDRKLYTPRDFIELLEENNEEFLRKMRASTKSFGKDIDEVNAFANDISRKIFGFTEGGELAFGEGFISASIQFNSQVAAGQGIGATPDGRVAHAPLCDSLAAIFGKDIYGPTALLMSVASLDLKGALGVPVVNFNITESFDTGVLRALILGYFEKGGVQLQITHASAEELLDAYRNPELHKNLIVRVGGYSEYFNHLSDELKKMIIGRTIQNSNNI